ncbi:MAG: DinB family protein [Chloroflexi bacterium]|nr:DinB family protein [Chloroflexota bacterium]
MENTTLNRTLEHMAWANTQMFTVLSALPAESLAYTSPGSEWSVGAIAHHLATAAENYAQRLHGEPRAEKRELPTTAADLQVLAAALAVADAKLRAGAQLPGDEILTWISFSGEELSVPRWVLVNQAVHHATEHRAQIAGALAANGNTTLDLDALDVWTYNDVL